MRSRLRFALAVAVFPFLGLSLAGLAAQSPSPDTGNPPTPDAALARIASLRNEVETKRGPTEKWNPSTLHQQLFGNNAVRTGAESRAAILYSDQTLQRLNENSELEIVAPTQEKRGLLRLLFGTHYFSSDAPKRFNEIETPAVAAAMRGTEFVVEVARDTTTTITVFEGRVEASNPQGTLMVGTGEQAYVEPGKAPVKRIVVRPRDAVAWALYYPAVLGGSDQARLAELGDDGDDLIRAAELLASGQVDQATPLIDGVRQRSPEEPTALALAAVTRVASNQNDEALRLAEAATTADPQSPAAALALSFAAQSVFDISRARELAEEAARLDPDGSLTLARAAELRMAEGDLKGAESAATLATRRDPTNARALSVLGFAKLAQFRTAEAEGLFENSIAADSEYSMPRLGLGLTRIRLGRIDDGLEQLEIATALDPGDSLLRSYLGKAYYEVKRSADAGDALAVARELDPADPTPYLYDAIRKQNENRPVEALGDLRSSIARNGNRAVYRSRLLLDEDRAVRASDLARIYNDLGFNRLGLVTARRSADDDHSNYSSHNLLAGTYRTIPSFAPAFLSEVLQARIYQPVSVNAARPDIVNDTVSFNEYTALLDRPRTRLFGTASYGETDEDLSELVDDPDYLESITVQDSRIQSGELVVTRNGDRYAAALGYRGSSTDGYRVNNDHDNETYRGFFQYSPTHRDSFQLNVQAGDQEAGDLPVRLFTTLVNPERFETDLLNVGVGYHRVLSPGSDLAVSLIYNDTEQTAIAAPGATPGQSTLQGAQLEVQQVLRRSWGTWVFGVGGFRGEVEQAGGAQQLETDDELTNGYAYLHMRPQATLSLTLGAALEHVVAPVGLLVPRDSRYQPTEIDVSETQLSPKLGITWFATPKTTARAAVYSRLSPAIGRVQSLEPTQVAGFNQFFFEPGGTESLSYGVGLDHEFGKRLFGGFSLLRRELTIPEAFCEFPNPFSGCISQQVSTVVDRESSDWHGDAYLNLVLGKQWAASLDYLYESREFDFFKIDNQAFFQDELRRQRVQPQLRWFHPNGLFASASGSYFDQEIDEFNTYDPRFGTTRTLNDDFWIVDLAVGYKLPRRYGSIVLEGRNLLNEKFAFFERAVEENLVPARMITLSLHLTL